MADTTNTCVLPTRLVCCTDFWAHEQDTRRCYVMYHIVYRIVTTVSGYVHMYHIMDKCIVAGLITTLTVLTQVFKVKTWLITFKSLNYETEWPPKSFIYIILNFSSCSCLKYFLDYRVYHKKVFICLKWFCSSKLKNINFWLMMSRVYLTRYPFTLTLSFERKIAVAWSTSAACVELWYAFFLW